MNNILSSLENSFIWIFPCTTINSFFIISRFNFDHSYYSFLFRWLHVLSGIMDWLLWYFNFVQIPNMPNIPDEQTAISKVIAPKALFWFRWPIATLITGLILGHLNGYI